ncbi:MAG: cytochrome c4 [Gammaproteobacteria bacterium]|nr:cytochrome c4 [Gammaproteobacteria bacterium]
MKLQYPYKILLLLCCSLFYNISYAATPSAAMLANTCAGCHGTNGSSVGPASPTIAGISKDYFIETMQAYKSGERPSTIMTRIAKGYTDEEIKLMAGFFSKQPFVRQSQGFDKNKATTGKKLHKKYCEKCHEKGGRSAEDDAGILAGQWEPYLRFTMEDFNNGSRSMEKKMKKKMQALNKSHGKKGVDALMHYYASQNK